MGNDLQNFVEKIVGINASTEEFTIDKARKIIKEMNEFLYTTYEGIGVIETLGIEMQFFSEFHRYWNENYKEILDAKIDDNKCVQVADSLYKIYKHQTAKHFRVFMIHVVCQKKKYVVLECLRQIKI